MAISRTKAENLPNIILKQLIMLKKVRTYLNKTKYFLSQTHKTQNFMRGMWQMNRNKLSAIVRNQVYTHEQYILQFSLL